jgi:hypothetical protein
VIQREDEADEADDNIISAERVEGMSDAPEDRDAHQEEEVQEHRAQTQDEQVVRDGGEGEPVAMEAVSIRTLRASERATYLGNKRQAARLRIA